MEFFPLSTSLYFSPPLGVLFDLLIHSVVITLISYLSYLFLSFSSSHSPLSTYLPSTYNSFSSPSFPLSIVTGSLLRFIRTLSFSTPFFFSNLTIHTIIYKIANLTQQLIVHLHRNNALLFSVYIKIYFIIYKIQTSIFNVHPLQIPLLLSMREEELALQKAVNSEDTDLIYLTLIHVERSRTDYVRYVCAIRFIKCLIDDKITL